MQGVAFNFARVTCTAKVSTKEGTLDNKNRDESSLFLKLKY